jgi:Tfp pilus tip-associated adhesin PilY1
MKRKNYFSIFLIFILSFLFVHISKAAIIYDTLDPASASIALGVNPQGHLNTSIPRNIVANSSVTGIARKISGTWRDATSPGCYCEGWGVSGEIINPAGFSEGIVQGYANVSVGGVYNLQVQSHTSDATSITSTVWIKDRSGNPVLEVTHKYGRSANYPNRLFQGAVTITNISGKEIRDVRYNRSMDWDVPQTEFREYVSISGVSASVAKTTFPKVLYAGNNGFMMPSPLQSSSNYMMGSPDGKARLNTDFYRSGPNDHGATFTFQFGNLACGGASNFMIYYGAADSRVNLETALAAEGVSIYSIGESSSAFANPFAFGFKGVSGVALAPTLPAKTAALPGQALTDENIVHTYAPPVLSTKIIKTGTLSSSTNYIYQAIFKYKKEKQWFGDILRYQLLANGDFDASAPLSASTLLQTKLNASNMDLPYNSGGRSIWTVGKDDNPRCSMSTGITNDINNNSFNLANQVLLGKLLFNCEPATPTEINNVINFVRGRDVYWEGTRTKNDPKPSILGDTFHSELVVVGPPNDPVSGSAPKTSEAYYRSQKSYASFVSTHQDRRKQFYVGANDGMLHAFDEDLNERWAFIPPSLLNKLRNMTGTVGSSPGRGKTNSSYFVDGPITVKDVYIESEKKWKTILMGGLGYGGKGYYVLDITNPDIPLHIFSFNHDVTRRLVEFWRADGTKMTWNYSCFDSNWWACPGGNAPISSASPGTRSPGNYDYAHLGDAWSKPIITLMPLKRWRPSIKQSWVAVFGAGYGNGDAVFTKGSSTDYGRYIYVVDLEPDTAIDRDRPYATPNGGATVGKISVSGDAASNIPFGVASPLTAISSDGTSLANYYGSLVYFTDLHGQLWKLNLSKKSLDDADDVYQLNRLFKSESTISKDRQGFNQLASTVVSTNQVFHYFGTGDQVYPQKRDPLNNNRIFGIRDQDFPSYITTKSGDLSVTANPSLIKNVDGLINNTSDLTACSSSNWYTNAYSRTTMALASTDYTKVIGRGRLFNKSISFSIYRPEDKTCPIYGRSQLIELNTETCASSVKTVATGLAVAPIADTKGNVYVGVSNLQPGTSVASGKDNIFKTTSPASSTSQKIKIKSWRELRN